ncbi:MAG: M56 family metallopeptidase [Ruminococcaceae bacterium]|nr:M56 family metallopeptidase [Oscillospiraceae bacterium]
MNDIFLKVLELSFSSSFIVLAIILLRAFLKKTPKWIFCLLWGLAGIRLVLPFSLESIFSLVPTMPVSSTSVPSGVEGHTFQTTQIFSVVWLAGVAVLAVYGILSYLRLYILVRPSINIENNVYICDCIDTPFIFGIIKPRIYVPSNLSREHIDCALKHELAHISRLDHLWKPLGFIIFTLHWFNPVVVLGYILLCRDIEKACDEKVISKMDNDSKLDYLESLVLCSVHRNMVSVCPVAFGEVGVRSRVKLIMNYKRPSMFLLVLCIALSLVIALCFFTSPKVDVNSYDSPVDSAVNDNSDSQSSDEGFNPFKSYSYSDKNTSFPQKKKISSQDSNSGSTYPSSYYPSSYANQKSVVQSELDRFTGNNTGSGVQNVLDRYNPGYITQGKAQVQPSMPKNMILP